MPVFLKTSKILKILRQKKVKRGEEWVALEREEWCNEVERRTAESDQPGGNNNTPGGITTLIEKKLA